MNWNILTWIIVIVFSVFVLTISYAEAMKNYELEEKLVEIKDCVYINSYLPAMPPFQAYAAPTWVIDVSDWHPKGFRPAIDQSEINWMLKNRCVEVEKHQRGNNTFFVIEDYGKCRANITNYYQNVELLGECYNNLPAERCRVGSCSKKHGVDDTTDEEESGGRKRFCWTIPVCWMGTNCNMVKICI